MSPQRIQRKRTKGWRMPKDAVYVRTTRPLETFIAADLLSGGNMSPEETVDHFRRALIDGRLQVSVASVRLDLAGPLRPCHVPAGAPTRRPCHADVLLLDLANEDGAP